MNMKDHPPLIIVSGAIGSGKGTIVHALSHELDLTWVPTHTTRVVRHDDNVLSRRVYDTEATFLRHVARGEMVEMIQIADHYYGLLREDLEKPLKQNKPAIIEMNVDGALKVVKEYPHSILIFIQADQQARSERITHRNMDPEEIKKRMQDTAKEEAIAQKEYDFLIENREGQPHHTIDAIKDIITQEFPELGDRV